jgi:hypothetical protein
VAQLFSLIIPLLLILMENFLPISPVEVILVLMVLVSCLYDHQEPSL